MKDSELKKLQTLIENGTPEKFYDWRVWRRLRQEVLKLDNFECQHCKAKGKYRKGYIVHHIKHLVDRPDLALSIFDGKERQLITLCKDCHEEEHPENLYIIKAKCSDSPHKTPHGYSTIFKELFSIPRSLNSK